MSNTASNPWLSKSPLKAFSVWLQDQKGDSGTLVVSSGAVYRKQSILTLEEETSGEGEEETTKPKLRVDYAAECYSCVAGSMKVTSKSFPMIVGALDGKLVSADAKLSSFTKLGAITVEDDKTGAFGSKPEDTKVELPVKAEGIEKPDENGKKQNPIPDIIRFSPLWYLDAGKDAFDNIILKNQKRIVESGIVLGKDVLSQKKEAALPEPKSEEEKAADKKKEDDPCDHSGSGGGQGDVNGGGPTETPTVPGDDLGKSGDSGDAGSGDKGKDSGDDPCKKGSGGGGTSSFA